jgi:hypothetical protein
MTTQILETCIVVLMVSFTSIVAVGSTCLVSGMIMVLLGKDKE